MLESSIRSYPVVCGSGCAGCAGGPVLVVCCWLCWWSAAAFLCFLLYDLCFAGGECATGSGAEAFPLQFNIDEWSKLLRSRFWSIFKDFSDEELEDGIEYMRKQNADKSVLHFPDRYWLIDITLK